ncbi:MAG: hypothetical protein L0922_02925, partial [Candidatus Mariimomonas ferrooxydans]
MNDPACRQNEYDFLIHCCFLWFCEINLIIQINLHTTSTITHGSTLPQPSLTPLLSTLPQPSLTA